MARQSITIRYGDIDRVAHELVEIQENIEEVIDDGIPWANFDIYWFTSLKTTASEIREALETLLGIAGNLSKVVQVCEDTEYQVKKALADYDSPEGYNTENPHLPPSFADEYYAGVDAANAVIEEEKRKKEEWAAKKEALLAFLATYYPEAYAAYMQKAHEAEEAEWLEGIKNDPELSWLYDLIMEEKEKQKKAAEAAEQAAEEAAKALEETGEASGADGLGAGPDSSHDSSLGSDLGGGGGGGGGLGDLGSGLGSDFGGGGGLGSGWESDLLDDAIDSDELLDAGDALGEIASADNPAATDTGMNAAGDVALDEAEAGALGAFGEKLASLASAYGMQAAAVAGAGVALYATREQTTEAVAHVAEFVSTRCKPFASDVMDQVSGAAKKTRVNLSHAKSRVVTPKRDEEAGDLIA